MAFTLSNRAYSDVVWAAHIGEDVIVAGLQRQMQVAAGLGDVAIHSSS
jgi:hypothetical protein